jgi:hypothetical protein
MILIKIALTYITVVAVAFPVLFSRSRWNSTLPGRATMLWSSIVAAVMLLSELRLLGVHVPEWTRVFVYLGIAVGVTMQLVLLLRVQYGRQTHRSKREDEIQGMRDAR